MMLHQTKLACFVTVKNFSAQFLQVCRQSDTRIILPLTYTIAYYA